MTSKATDDPRTKASSEHESADADLVCCDSACIVCVLDYPDFSHARKEAFSTSVSETPELIEALAQAELLLDLLDQEKSVTLSDIEGGQ